jgi:3-oxoacyl-[acyl-carrier protein] reductase
MDLELQDKVVIVSGASGGIGMAICNEFLLEGSIVVALFRGKEEKLNELKEWATRNNIGEEKLFPLEMDISDEASVNAGIAVVMKQFGKIDVLVNCAGFSFERPFALTEDKEWDKIIEINLSATARLCRSVLKPMFRQKKGAIVNISSGLSARFGRGNVAYASAKAAVNRFSQALATEVGAKGIRVNVVCPGVVETKMSDALTTRLGDLLKELTPLARNGKPEEIAKPVVFLASEKAASYITGATLFVDGGSSL